MTGLGTEPRGETPIILKTGHTGSGLKTNPGEDQAELPVPTTVVRQGPVSTGWHSAGGLYAKTGHTGSGLKTDPGEGQVGLPVLTTAVR